MVLPSAGFGDAGLTQSGTHGVSSQDTVGHMSGPVTEAKGVIRNRSVLAVRMEDVKGQEGAETRISCTDKKAKTQSLEWAKAY